MKAPNSSQLPNTHDSRESWLRAGANELRPYFQDCGYPLPDKIRYAIAFTSTGRKSKRYGECWHASSSEDSAYEIFIRADLAEQRTYDALRLIEHRAENMLGFNLLVLSSFSQFNGRLNRFLAAKCELV